MPGLALVLACFSCDSAAHGAAGNETGWTLTLALLLSTSAVGYAIGVRRLWRRAGAGRGVRGGHVLRFALGWLVLAVALLSPIDAFADRSFAVHMLQHELLMLVAAPLFVLARPLEAWTWALPQRMRRRAANVAHASWARGGWHAMTSQSGAWCLHASALWIWHVPMLFIAAAANPSLHVLQHTCFLGSALLFWWSVLRDRAGSHAAGAVLAVFTTMLHTSALGTLLTLAAHPSYIAPGQTTTLGLTALEDQQLGGLIMWVPGSLAYLVAALSIVAVRLSPARINHDVA
ncbi:MAG TPA: cytochrome c oxidase assembly protein [Casimicrobiaceae bacterium]